MTSVIHCGGTAPNGGEALLAFVFQIAQFVEPASNGAVAIRFPSWENTGAMKSRAAGDGGTVRGELPARSNRSIPWLPWPAMRPSGEAATDSHFVGMSPASNTGCQVVVSQVRRLRSDPVLCRKRPSGRTWRTKP